MMTRENLSGALIRENIPLGESLRQVREARGYSLRALASKTHEQVTAAGISRIERGERIPNSATLVALAQALGGKFIIDSDGLHFYWQQEGGNDGGS